MQIRLIPARTTFFALAMLAVAVLGALLAGVSVLFASRAAAVVVLLLIIAAVADYLASRNAWRRASTTLTRALPPAFAIAVKRPLAMAIETHGAATDGWRGRVYDHVDSSLQTEGLPAAADVAGATRLELTYLVTPTLRGEVAFAPADVRVRSRLGFCE